MNICCQSPAVSPAYRCRISFKGRIYTYLTGANGRRCHSAVMLQNRCEMLSRTAGSQFSGDGTRMRCSPASLGAGSCALTSGIEYTTGVHQSYTQSLIPDVPDSLWSRHCYFICYLRHDAANC